MRLWVIEALQRHPREDAVSFACPSNYTGKGTL